METEGTVGRIESITAARQFTIELAEVIDGALRAWDIRNANGWCDEAKAGLTASMFIARRVADWLAES